MQLLNRLLADFPELVSSCGLSAEAELVRVEPAGDYHNGDAVQVLRFSDGARVVYKPRSVLPESLMTRLCEWLRDAGVTDIASPRTVVRDHYGWTEFVAQTPASSDDDAREHFHSIGTLLAVLHALRGGDIHVENVVATSRGSVVIDAECLAQGVLFYQPESNSRSVVDIGFLPDPRPHGKSGNSVDLSVLGYSADVPSAAYSIVDGGTDRERVELRGQAAPEYCAQLAFADGTLADPLQYRSDIRLGFRRAYEALVAHRMDAGFTDLIEELSRATVRYVHRASWQYGLMLRDLEHPTYLRSAASRKRYAASVLGLAAGPPESDAIAQAEEGDLLQGDIPVFRYSPGVGTLIDASGAAIGVSFPRPPIEEVWEGIASLGTEDLEAQTELLDLSFDLRTAVRTRIRPSYAPVVAETIPIRDIERAVRSIVLELERTCRGDDGDIWWAAPQPIGRTGYRAGRTGVSLYDGAAGIAMFVAAASRWLDLGHDHRLGIPPLGGHLE